MRPIVMTINGSDPTGQTGIAADLAVFRTHRLATQCVVTAVQGPSEIYPLPTTVVGGELAVALREAAPAAVKLGVLGTGEVASSIAAYMRDRLRNVVLDPELDARLGSSPGRGRGDPGPVAARDRRDAECRGGVRAGRVADREHRPTWPARPLSSRAWVRRTS